jgi:hypothetical protein
LQAAVRAADGAARLGLRGSVCLSPARIHDACRGLGQFVGEAGQSERMSDPAGGSAAAHPLSSLPRAWWFPTLRGYRSEVDATYVRHDLDESLSGILTQATQSVR